MFRILDDLISLGEGGLRELWQRGTPPAAEELAGWVFRGWNTSRVTARSPVGGRAFAKGFFREGTGVAGCNFVVRVRAGEWQIDTSHPFGFFAVTPVADWSHRRAALLLDYGRGRGRELLAAWGVRPGLRLRLVGRLARPLRDLVVRPPHAADGLYVGRAFVTSTLKLPVSCFALERWSPMPAALGGPQAPRRRAEHAT